MGLNVYSIARSVQGGDLRAIEQNMSADCSAQQMYKIFLNDIHIKGIILHVSLS